MTISKERRDEIRAELIDPNTPVSTLKMAKTILALLDAIDAAEKALKPFAEEARRYEPPEDDDAEPAFDSQFTYGELRRARAALNGGSDG